MTRRLAMLACLSALLFGASARAAQDGATLPGTSLYNLDETWVNQDGARVSLASLRGKLVVAAMGYTTCKDMCPAIVGDMLWVDKRVPPELLGDVRFVFLTFDSEADSPDRLKLYAIAHELDLKRWTLLGADPDTVREFAAALDVSYRPDGAGGFDHTAIISLLDRDGVVVFQQRGAQADSDELLAKLKTLTQP